MKVLVACEFSGIVREAFARRGHDAWSCDLLPTEIEGQHIQDDVLKHLEESWDMMIAHPPCTYLSYVGTRHWNNEGRYKLRLRAINFFMKFVEAPIEKICIENPLGIMSQVYRPPDQTIHPYYFGDDARKRTCLWLKNLPPLVYQLNDDLFGGRTATDIPEPVYHLKTSGKAIHWTEAVKGERKRSKTFPSIAEAMANQWNILPNGEGE